MVSTNGNLVTGILANLPIFRHTPAAMLAALARKSRTLHMPRGSTIARRGEELPGLMAVAYGLVKLSLRGEASEKVLRLVGAGDTFGEAVLFLEKPLPVDISALSDTLLVVVPAEPLRLMIDTEPGFARAMLASMSQRLHALVVHDDSGVRHLALDVVIAPFDGFQLGQHLFNIFHSSGTVLSRSQYSWGLGRAQGAFGDAGTRRFRVGAAA